MYYPPAPLSPQIIPCVYQAGPFHPLCPEIHKGARMLPLTTSQMMLKRGVRAACCVILKSGQSEASDATYSMVATQWNRYLLGRSSRWVKCMYSSSVVAMTSQLHTVMSSTLPASKLGRYNLYFMVKHLQQANNNLGSTEYAVHCPDSGSCFGCHNVL